MLDRLLTESSAGGRDPVHRSDTIAWCPRTRTKTEISYLAVRMATENPAWGYTRIQGALAHVGHELSRGTIVNILKEQGIEPAFERSERTPWRTFLRAHRETLAAPDFFTIEVARPTGWSRTTFCSSSS